MPIDRTGPQWPLLHEIRYALERLADTGEETTLDLRALPLSLADRDRLAAFLGQGEARAELSCLGQSLIRETSYAGVWWVEHFDPEGRQTACHIAVCRVPAILASQPEDMRAALQNLSARLAE